MMKEHKIRVLLVDDHPIVREGLRHVLSATEDIQVIGEAASCAEALTQLRQQDCDIALVDISLPDQSGLALQKSIVMKHPHIRAIILSSYSENDFALKALRDGACGYVMKSAANDELATAIRVVASGGKYLSERMMEKLGGDFITGDSMLDRQLFSDREQQVLTRLALGKRLTEIGSELNLSIKTVSTYRTRIMEKTGYKTNAELVRFALDQGLIS